MITRIKESKTLTKHISCECNCKFNGTKEQNIIEINGEITMLMSV